MATSGQGLSNAEIADALKRARD
uniref:Uncharacterized protein n=1 Tax=Romanomermis culicivorax TaxID=13658 RepID=A0A915I933_ROMCU